MPRDDGKPAGWRFYDAQFWQRGDDKKCHECLKVSSKSAGPAESHERKCSAFPAGSIVRGPDLPAPPPSVEREYAINAILRRVDKPRPRIRDRSYMAFVRSHACVSCGNEEGIEAHHWGPRGVGQKCDDVLCVALCMACHGAFHAKNALPGQTRAETEVTLLRAQVSHLVEWIAERKLADALDASGEEPI